MNNCETLNLVNTFNTTTVEREREREAEATEIHSKIGYQNIHLRQELASIQTTEQRQRSQEGCSGHGRLTNQLLSKQNHGKDRVQTHQPR